MQTILLSDVTSLALCELGAAAALEDSQENGIKRPWNGKQSSSRFQRFWTWDEPKSLRPKMDKVTLTLVVYLERPMGLLLGTRAASRGCATGRPHGSW